MEFSEESAYEDAKQIVREAVLNFKNRDKSKVLIPELKSSATVGYSLDAILGQLDRVVNSQIDPSGTLKPLADCLKSGVLRGVVGVVGCNNARSVSNKAHMEIMKELIKNDILVVTTGCGASAAGKHGLLTKEARKLAGKGLATVCELVDIPPVIHLGSCVDCSRILQVVAELANFLDMDISEIPVAGVAPEWMSEKAVAIGTYVVASGIDTYLGIMPPVGGSSRTIEILCDELQNKVGAKFTANENPQELAQIIISDMEKKRVSFEQLVEEKTNQLVEVEA
jgi:carbon-monoxide dehydrogenase catalytic subunit